MFDWTSGTMSEREQNESKGMNTDWRRIEGTESETILVNEWTLSVNETWMNKATATETANQMSSDELAQAWCNERSVNEWSEINAEGERVQSMQFIHRFTEGNEIERI